MRTKKRVVIKKQAICTLRYVVIMCMALAAASFVTIKANDDIPCKYCTTSVVEAVTDWYNNR